MTAFRRHGRKNVKFPLKLSHDDIGDFFAETIDVSESGIFVSSKDVVAKLAVGDTVNSELSCSLLESEASAAPANAELKVVRVTYSGAALEFS